MWEKSRGGHSGAEQGSRSKDRDLDRGMDQIMETSKLNNPVSQTGPSGFYGFRAEEAFEDHHARDGSSTSLVSFRPHTQPEEEDSMDVGVEDEGRGGQEGKRLVLQHHPASDPDEARVEGEGVGRHATPTTSHDDMDLLKDDEALLIKDESPPPTDMDINMVFTLLAQFRGIE
jgi:hypothetical protein